MASNTLIVFGRALTDLGLAGEQLARYGVIVKASETVDDSGGDVGYALLDDSTDGNGLLAQIQQLQTEAPRRRILVIMRNSTIDAVAYLRAGAVGLLKAPMSAEQLNAVLEHVRDGQVYLEPVIAQVMAMRQIKKLLQPFDELTSREYDVFCMLAEGLSLMAIARQLDVSPKTVSNCQTKIKIKLGLESREAIAGFAKKHGLIN